MAALAGVIERPAAAPAITARTPTSRPARRIFRPERLCREAIDDTRPRGVASTEVSASRAAYRLRPSRSDQMPANVLEAHSGPLTQNSRRGAATSRV